MIKLNLEVIIWRDAARHMRKPLRGRLVRLATVGFPIKENDEAVTLLHEFATEEPDLNTSEELDYTDIPRIQIIQRLVIAQVEISAEHVRRVRAAIKRKAKEAASDAPTA